jgi:chromate transporter
MDLNLLFRLFYEFMIVGIFAIGGGMSALPLIENVVVRNNWLTSAAFYQMVAISESTPGPIGINVATYVGYDQAGLIGGITASLATVFLPFVFLMIIIRALNKYYKTKAVQAIFKALRATIIGLILTAAFNISTITLFEIELISIDLLNAINYGNVIIFIIILFGFMKYKKHPLLYIGAGALLGLVSGFFGNL